MQTLDFTTARVKHLTWKTKLRAFLDGRGNVTEAQATSPRDCDLGKWLYSSGMTQYGKHAEMQQLEMAHNELHAAVKKILRAKQKGQTGAAEEEFKKIEPIGAKMDSLLTALENKLCGLVVHN